MKEIVIKSYNELEEYVGSHDDFCYRGQSDSRWSLAPKLYRGLSDYIEKLDNNIIHTIARLERDIYRRFLDKSRPYQQDHGGVNWMDLWEQLCVAQHYGVPTRLLDWTSSFLVATFFAVFKYDKPTDAAVWCLDLSGLPEFPAYLGRRSGKKTGVRAKNLPTKDVSFLQPVTSLAQPPNNQDPFFVMIQPPDIDDRIKNQKGLLSCYVSFDSNQFVWDYLDYLQHVENSVSRTVLHKIVIPRELKYNFLTTLIDRDTDLAMLFPGLHGLGLHLSFELNRSYGDIFRLKTS